MRHDWTAFPDGPDEKAYLLSVTTLETGEPVTNASAEELAKEVLRLAEEVERLKRENALLRDGQTGDLIQLGADNEHARLRRELQTYLLGMEDDNAIVNGSPEHAIELIRSALDRIVPGES